jgi:hypothetical protein
LEILSTTELLQRIEARNEHIRSVHAQGKATINLGASHFTVEEFITVEKPASLRIEAFSLIGQPLFYLTTDGNVFEALIPSENRFYRGTISSKHFSARFPFFTGIGKIIPLMAGEMTRTDEEGLSTQYSPRDNAYVISQDLPEGSRRIYWIDPLHFATIRAIELDHSRHARWEIHFAHFKKRDGIHFPTDVEFHDFGSGRSMKAHLLEWEINPPLKKGLFRLDAPKGVQVIDLQ